MIQLSHFAWEEKEVPGDDVISQRQAFLPWALLTLRADNSFLYGDDLHSSSIPGLCPLDASGTHTKL